MWSFFWWSTMRNFSEGLALSTGPFQKIQHEVIYFPYVNRKNEIPLWSVQKYTIHGKNREISGPYNFWTLIKSSIRDLKLKLLDLVWFVNCVGGPWPPTPSPVATPLYVISKSVKDRVVIVYTDRRTWPLIIYFLWNCGFMFFTGIYCISNWFHVFYSSRKRSVISKQNKRVRGYII